MMRQYGELKRRFPDYLLLFRLGDFYELFNDDAVEGSKLLDLTLTSRNNGGSKAPLAGIPAHALETYLRRLVAAGRRVAICDQVEDPALAHVRTDCLDALRGSETELRRYFEKHEESVGRSGAVWKSVTWRQATRI